MKKNIIAALALCGLALTGCQQAAEVENTIVPELETAEVSFTAQLPEDILTRALSDGTKATELTYAVYATDTKDIVLKGTGEFSNLSCDLTLTLVKGQSYDLVFWAQNPDVEYYTVDLDAQTVTMDYADDAIDANDEDRDAFFASITALTISDETEAQSVELKRPFAQINIGAEDLETGVMANYSVEDLTFTLTVKNVPTVLNLLSGEASGSQTVTYEATGLIDVTDEFPADNTQTYVMMNYVLMTADKATQDVTLSVSQAAGEEEEEATAITSLTVNSCPLQRNYRTNIYGSLFQETTKVTVTIVPGLTGDVYPETEDDED